MFRISLYPSNRTLTALPEETVLESLLGSGIHARYNCSNGSCGQCRARLVSGELGERQHHDYVFADHEKDSGYFLMCQNRPVSDLCIEADLIADTEDIPSQTIEASVYRIETPVDHFRVLTLRTPRSHTLQFLAGQHVKLTLPNGEKRSKSIASCPCNGRYLEFHFHQQESDSFNNYIFNDLNSREAIEVEGPFGDFTFDELSSRPVILIATDVGFAPIKSLIEQIISLEVRQPIHLFWFVQHLADDYLSNYCRSWLASEDNFFYSEYSMDELDIEQSLDSEQAQVAMAEKVQQVYADLNQHDVYMNGPKDSYSILVDALTRLNLPPDRLFIDSMRCY